METSETINWRQLLGVEVRKGCRKHARYPASERVAIILHPGFGDVPSSVQGEFVDRSESGCRIRHTFGDLRVQSEVALVWADDHRSAVVIWNQSTGSITETGFQFID